MIRAERESLKDVRREAVGAVNLLQGRREGTASELGQLAIAKALIYLGDAVAASDTDRSVVHVEGGDA